MSYHYTDTNRENDPHALPDVEIFEINHTTLRRDYREFVLGMMADAAETDPTGLPIDYVGFWYASGFPGCLWDSEPVGPFDTEAEALAEARESAGY